MQIADIKNNVGSFLN